MVQYDFVLFYALTTKINDYNFYSIWIKGGKIVVKKKTVSFLEETKPVEEGRAQRNTEKFWNSRAHTPILIKFNCGMRSYCMRNGFHKIPESVGSLTDLDV